MLELLALTVALSPLNVVDDYVAEACQYQGPDVTCTAVTPNPGTDTLNVPGMTLSLSDLEYVEYLNGVSFNQTVTVTDPELVPPVGVITYKAVCVDATDTIVSAPGYSHRSIQFWGYGDPWESGTASVTVGVDGLCGALESRALLAFVAYGDHLSQLDPRTELADGWVDGRNYVSLPGLRRITFNASQECTPFGGCDDEIKLEMVPSSAPWMSCDTTACAASARGEFFGGYLAIFHYAVAGGVGSNTTNLTMGSYWWDDGPLPVGYHYEVLPEGVNFFDIQFDGDTVIRYYVAGDPLHEEFPEAAEPTQHATLSRSDLLDEVRYVPQERESGIGKLAPCDSWGDCFDLCEGYDFWQLGPIIKCFFTMPDGLTVGTIMNTVYDDFMDSPVVGEVRIMVANVQRAVSHIRNADQQCGELGSVPIEALGREVVIDTCEVSSTFKTFARGVASVFVSLAGAFIVINILLKALRLPTLWSTFRGQ